MNSLNKILIDLNTKTKKDSCQETALNNVKVIKEINASKQGFKKTDFDASYYGDPYAYDCCNLDFEDIDWRKQWVG